MDCSLRDGGYYNVWDFPAELVTNYLVAMQAASVDVVELGFRFLKNEGFKGAHAFTTDDYLRGLSIPNDLTIGVMVNGADLFSDLGREAALERLFLTKAEDSPVDLVRLACHYRELEAVFPAVEWLHSRGYRVGVNLMQISERTEEELHNFARMASATPVEVLYFADSMGGMTPSDTAAVIRCLRTQWDGPIGVHTHDNLGLALSNTLKAADEGATWLDATVTGMGRGPGNARTEELAVELGERRGQSPNLVPLMSVIRRHFDPMRTHYGWGTNPYYYLAGKYGIHPTYIQEMLGDERYDDEDILAVIDHLREAGGSKFSVNTLHGARNFYTGPPEGSWTPAEMMQGRDVLILGSGPGVGAHRSAVEAFIRRESPLVLALNTQSAIAEELIDLRIASHPVRLLADAAAHQALPQPLITPYSALPDHLQARLAGKNICDFGLNVQSGQFAFNGTDCVTPTPLVLAYALATVTCGAASSILMAGFDGYPPGDPRNDEVESMIALYHESNPEQAIHSITPTSFKALAARSVYAL
jgi:4-hydroxy 2-oxovalerate aldolase